jgi:hypothetical protein
VDRNLHSVLHVFPFDENLHEHISHELADDAGREGDTSWPVEPGLCVSPWAIHRVSGTKPRNDRGWMGGKQVTSRNKAKIFSTLLTGSEAGFFVSLQAMAKSGNER